MTLFHWNWTKNEIKQKVIKVFKCSLELCTERFILEGTSLFQSLSHSRDTTKGKPIAHGHFRVISEEWQWWRLPWVSGLSVLNNTWYEVFIPYFMSEFPCCHLRLFPVVLLLSPSDNSLVFSRLKRTRPLRLSCFLGCSCAIQWPVGAPTILFTLTFQ